MTHPAINPELMLKAAEMAIPGSLHWECLPDRRIYAESDMGGIFFDPLTSNSDAWALERALKKEGWSFYYSDTAAFPFNAIQHGIAIPIGVGDDSDTLLLLKCVSAQTGIPLHAKGVEG